MQNDSSFDICRLILKYRLSINDRIFAKEIHTTLLHFYLSDREEVNPAFLSLQLAHEHGCTNQQEVRHSISVHVQGAQNASKVRANLGQALAADDELYLAACIQWVAGENVNTTSSNISTCLPLSESMIADCIWALMV